MDKYIVTWVIVPFLPNVVKLLTDMVTLEDVFAYLKNSMKNKQDEKKRIRQREKAELARKRQKGNDEREIIREEQARIREQDKDQARI